MTAGVFYATREAVKRALDFAETARNDGAVDRALAGAKVSIDRLVARRGFDPVTATLYFDFPARSQPTPYRVWFDDDHLVELTAVTSGGTTLDTAYLKPRPANTRPWSHLEIDLSASTSLSFGQGSTPQDDVAVTGVWAGCEAQTAAAGALAAAVVSTTATTVDVSNAGAVGVGDLLTVDSERLVVTGRTMLDTGQTVAGGGLTASTSSVALTVSGGTFHADEVLLVDSERMLVVDVAGSVVTVKRAWDGTVLAAHTAGTAIYASRRLTVTRGANGSTAATHLIGASLARQVYPGDVVQLAVAEAAAALVSERAAYGRESGAGGAKSSVEALGLPGLRAAVQDAHGRGIRHEAV